MACTLTIKVTSLFHRKSTHICDKLLGTVQRPCFYYSVVRVSTAASWWSLKIAPNRKRSNGVQTKTNILSQTYFPITIFNIKKDGRLLQCTMKFDRILHYQKFVKISITIFNGEIVFISRCVQKHYFVYTLTRKLPHTVVS